MSAFKLDRTISLGHLLTAGTLALERVCVE